MINNNDELFALLDLEVATRYLLDTLENAPLERQRIDHFFSQISKAHATIDAIRGYKFDVTACGTCGGSTQDKICQSGCDDI